MPGKFNGESIYRTELATFHIVLTMGTKKYNFFMRRLTQVQMKMIWHLWSLLILTRFSDLACGRLADDPSRHYIPKKHKLEYSKLEYSKQIQISNFLGHLRLFRISNIIRLYWRCVGFHGRHRAFWAFLACRTSFCRAQLQIPAWSCRKLRNAL